MEYPGGFSDIVGCLSLEQIDADEIYEQHHIGTDPTKCMLNEAHSTRLRNTALKPWDQRRHSRGCSHRFQNALLPDRYLRGVGLLSVMGGVGSAGVVPVYGLLGLLQDVSLTPFIYKDRAWIYHCSGLRGGHTGVFYLDDSDDSKTKKYIRSLGCQRVGSNPPWLHVAK